MLLKCSVGERHKQFLQRNEKNINIGVNREGKNEMD
jgi:hypothetical protein